MSGAHGSRQLTVLIAGPTGGGKSQLALDLARGLDGVVINADAMQVYRELRVLTARPGVAEEAKAPHRLYGMVAAGDAYSAGRWREDAAAEIAEVHARGRAAIIVGGTGLYFATLLSGLARIPPVPENIRLKWRKVLSEEGLEAVRSELESRDPEMAGRIAAGDRQRAVRALEVLEASGRSLGWWQRRDEGEAVPLGETVRIVVSPPREQLHQRIEGRAEAMVQAGGLEEVRALMRLQLDPGLPVMKAIGVRELAPVLAGESDLEGGLALMCTATRRYAKRQLTWARKHMGDWRWVESAREGSDAAKKLVGG